MSDLVEVIANEDGHDGAQIHKAGERFYVPASRLQPASADNPLGQHGECWFSLPGDAPKATPKPTDKRPPGAGPKRGSMAGDEDVPGMGPQ